MKGPVQSLQVSYLLHATEEEGKVRGAVESLLGVRVFPEAESLEGHFGNEIRRVELRLTGDEAEAGLRGVISRMPRGVAEELAEGISSYLDEHGALFLRFDKQELVLGRVALGSADPVRLKVRPRGYLLRGGAPGFYLRLLRGG